MHLSAEKQKQIIITAALLKRILNITDSPYFDICQTSSAWLILLQFLTNFGCTVVMKVDNGTFVSHTFIAIYSRPVTTAGLAFYRFPLGNN
jgi:hypothetical protein